MMITVIAKCEKVRKMAFSLSMLLQMYLETTITVPVAFSRMDRIRYLECLLNLVTGIKFSIQKRLWRQPGPFNELFDENEVFDVKWVQLINPLWFGLLGTISAALIGLVMNESLSA